MTKRKTSEKIVSKTVEKENKSIINKSAFIDYVYNRTVEWGAKYGWYPKDKKQVESKCSSKAKEIVSIIDKSQLGCQAETVRSIIEVILDEKLPELKESSDKSFLYIKSILIFVLSDPKGKNLPVGEVLFVKNVDGEAFNSNNEKFSVYNNLTSNSFRLPTKNEIEEFFDEFGDENLNNLIINF